MLKARIQAITSQTRTHHLHCEGPHLCLHPHFVDKREWPTYRPPYKTMHTHYQPENKIHPHVCISINVLALLRLIDFLCFCLATISR